MYGKNKISLDKALMERVKEAAAKGGYSSTDEFVAHILERELAKGEGGSSDADVKKQLEGLGYIS
jgi:metal-responsive CopG/Arc/MetJ family transcriptional regulator